MEGVNNGKGEDGIREKKEDFFFQAEDGIRDLVRSRGLGDVYKGRLQKRRGY